MAASAHGLAQSLHQGFDGNKLLHAPGYLNGYSDSFPIFSFYGKCGDPALSCGLNFIFDYLFEVLRVNVLPADDNEVLVPSCDINLPFVKESEIACAQPAL